MGPDPGVVAVCCVVDGVPDVEAPPVPDPLSLSLGTGGAGLGGPLLPFLVARFPGTCPEIIVISNKV